MPKSGSIQVSRSRDILFICGEARGRAAKADIAFRPGPDDLKLPAFAASAEVAEDRADGTFERRLEQIGPPRIPSCLLLMFAVSADATCVRGHAE